MTDRTPSVPDSVREVAEHILVCCAGDQDATSEQKINAIVLELERFGRAQYERGVKDTHREIALKQELVHGESVMLGGKVVTNEELYRQPTDYIREAKAEGFKSGIEKAADLLDMATDGGKGDQLLLTMAEKIRALLPKEGAKG